MYYHQNELQVKLKLLIMQGKQFPFSVLYLMWIDITAALMCVCHFAVVDV